MKRSFIVFVWSACAAFAAQAASPAAHSTSENIPSAKLANSAHTFHIQQADYDVVIKLVDGHEKVKQQPLAELVQNTAEVLAPQSKLVADLSRPGAHDVPAWIFEGLAKCEDWFHLTEGKVSCRNGALYQYWHQYVAGEGTLERREARKLARASRVTKVTLNTPSQLLMPEIMPQVMPQSMPDAPFWDFGLIGDALLANRIAKYLQQIVGEDGAFSITVNKTSITHEGKSPSGWTLFDKPVMAHHDVFSGAIIDTASRKVVIGAAESGVLDSSDGWPASGLTSHVVAPNVFDAAIVSQLAVVSSTTQLNDFLVDKPEVLVKTTDQKGRVNTTEGYFAFWQNQHDTAVKPLTIDVTLPRFNVPEYHGPYVSVWLTDENAQLIKSLSIRGDSQRWLTELRVWWRKIGRTHEDFIDGFAGATRKNKPLHVLWDGYDEKGQPVKQTKLVLNVEVAREGGGRNYQKIPLDLEALMKQPLHAVGKGEIGEVSVSL